MTRSTISRRQIAALGLGMPFVVLAGRSAAAHEGHDAATPSTMQATPGATPTMGNTGTAAAYMTIQGTGAHNETLLGARTDVARTVELHTMAVDDSGVMQMQPLPAGLEIPAGESVQLAPQGYHFMLIDLTRDLMPGSTYDLVLRFARAGEVPVTVSVQMIEPEDAGTVSGTGEDVSILAAWSRPAPRIDGEPATPSATPSGHHG